MPRKRLARKTEKKRKDEPNHSAPDLLPPIDFHGHSVRIVESNEIPELGLTWHDGALIEIRTKQVGSGEPMNPRSIVDTVLHEAFHAGLHGNSGALRLRKLLKLNARQWAKMEETLICEFTAAVAGPLFDAGVLVFPRLPERPRHRSRKVKQS